MSNTTYYQRNRDVILNRVEGYYENNKKRLREQATDNYRNLSEEDKNKKREYGRNRYHNISEEKKHRLKKNIKQITVILKNKDKKFAFFSFHCIKHGTGSSVFRRKWYH